VSSGSRPEAGTWRRLMARALVFHEAVAERLGINATDLKCLELAADEEPITPTRLAELAGLTSGAITGVLDRLERARIVRREPDPEDRRRIIVRVLPDRARELAAIYAPLLAATSELADHLDPAQRTALAEYLERAAGALEGETARLRATVRGGMVGDTFIAPLASATRGRLVFASGAPRLAMSATALGQQVRMVAETSASRLTVAGGTDADELIHASFEGPPPEVRAADGVVTVRYRRRALDFRSRAARIALNPRVPWSFEVDGGLTDLEADLRSLQFEGLAVRGGANHLSLRLPRPDGSARLAISGGASNARIERPVGTAVSLRVRGGVSHLTFDDQRLQAATGDTHLQSSDFADAAARYEIELSGGVNHLTVRPR
jgi:DNA-binding MarR family transcriptional regulator